MSTRGAAGVTAAVACCAGFTRQSIDLVGVARSDIAGDLGAFFQIAADHDLGGRRADVVGLLKAAIAAIEARDHLLVAVSARPFGIDHGMRSEHMVLRRRHCDREVRYSWNLAGSVTMCSAIK